MTAETFTRRVAEVESYVRHTSFGCLRDECRRDFYDHGQQLIDVLTSLIEAEFYQSDAALNDVSIDNSCSLFANRVGVEVARFLDIWRMECV